MLDAVAAVEGYGKLPFIIDEAERLGARQELKNLLQTEIDGVEWSQAPKRGEALIEIDELPVEFGLEREKDERPDDSSSGRPNWLPGPDGPRTISLVMELKVPWAATAMGWGRSNQRKIRSALLGAVPAGQARPRRLPLREGPDQQTQGGAGARKVQFENDGGHRRSTPNEDAPPAVRSGMPHASNPRVLTGIPVVRRVAEMRPS